MKINDRQLELGLEGARRCRTSNLRARRRAGWWFERIRQVVDSAEETPARGNPDEAAAVGAKKDLK
jgi:hypothetical protein